MTGWLLVLILFLWIFGGSAWINSYEASEETELDPVGKVLVTLLWPLMAIAAGMSTAWREIQVLTGRTE